MDSINVNGDPKIIGPGVWYITHLKAKEATTDNKINDFIEYMEFLAAKFSCKNCRKHIRAYIDTHPFEDLRYMTNEHGDRVGMFKWTWLFHNAVNTRIHKPYVDWDTAWGMYDDNNEACSKNCDAAGSNNHEVNNHEVNNEVNNNDSNTNSIKEIRKSPAKDGFRDKNDKYSSVSSFKMKPKKLFNEHDRRSRLAQGYFMSIGIPETLHKNGIDI